jgi:hypothetical protein
MNLTNLAVSGLVANSITQGMFNSNLIDFATGRTDGAFKAGADGSYRLTIPELLGMGKGGVGGNYATGLDLQTVLATNFKNNWGQMAMGVILIPIAANVITKVIRKPVILPANRLLKATGLGKDFRV